MDYFDLDHKEHAEARRHAREERRERQARARRKRARAFGLIALAFVLSLLVGLAARARNPSAASSGSRVAEVTKVPAETPTEPTAAGGSPESVRIDIGAQGYEPDVVRVKAGVPVRVTVGRGEGCAAGFLMNDLGIAKDNSNGPVTFTIGPLKPGTYRFTCGMEMVQGSIVAG